MIYLDHHAATPLCPAARAAMDAVGDAWANPASVHAAGRAARAHLERARDRIAAAVGATSHEIVLTSGGTEACNLAVFGVPAKSILASDVEHPAIRAALRVLERRGVPVRSVSTLMLMDEAKRIAPDTLVVVQWVNHETGQILDVAGISERVAARGGHVVVDGTQAFGKVATDLSASQATAVAFAAHKIGGPAGAGALFLRRGIDIDPQLVGGSQERGRRGGAPDLRALIGFGAACERVGERVAAMPRVAILRDALEAELVSLGGVRNGAEGERVATVTNVSFERLRGEALVAALDLEGLCASTGAACSSGLSEPSPVILALYPKEPWRASCALRLSLGFETQEREITEAVHRLHRVIGRMRASLEAT